MQYLKLPKSNKQTRIIRALNIEEQIKLINVLIIEKPKYWEQMIISMYTGMRCGEINALSVYDIDFNRNIINIDKTISMNDNGKLYIKNHPKTAAGVRQVPISRYLKPFLETLVNNTNEENIFKEKTNKIISTESVGCSFKKLLSKYNIVDNREKGDLVLHSLRHTYATRCVEAGMSPKVLQKILGHTEIETTLDIYTSVSKEYKESNMKIINQYMNDTFGTITL